MLGEIVINGFGLTDVDIDLCPYQILTCMGGLEKARRLTKQEIVIQVNSNKLTNYIIVWPRVVVSCDVLVGGVVLYPLGVTIDFWEEIAYYCCVWQTKANHKVSLLVRFIGGKQENLISQLCWLDFQAFCMDLSYWKVTFMTKMHLQLVNWQCQGHKGWQLFQFPHWIPSHLWAH
jgi:hypothetical protein